MDSIQHFDTNLKALKHSSRPFRSQHYYQAILTLPVFCLFVLHIPVLVLLIRYTTIIKLILLLRLDIVSNIALIPPIAWSSVAVISKQDQLQKIDLPLQALQDMDVLEAFLFRYYKF